MARTIEKGTSEVLAVCEAAGEIRSTLFDERVCMTHDLDPGGLCNVLAKSNV